MTKSSLISLQKEHDLFRITQLSAPAILAPDGSKFFLYVPKTPKELSDFWDVLVRYTEDNATNPEMALQDLDKIEDVMEYHFGPEMAYAVIGAVDRHGKPKAVTPTELATVDDVLENGDRRGTGFIYQIGIDKELSDNYRDFSLATGMYRIVPELLRKIFGKGYKGWVGVSTESRKDGPELEAILKAGFTVLVPNRYYRPPATQEGEITDPSNLFTDSLVLLETGVPKGSEKLVSDLYMVNSYCEGQNVEHSLKLMAKNFEKSNSTK